MKRTPWFPVSVNPVRVGWYECLFLCFGTWLVRYWWDGLQWKHAPTDIEATSFGITGDKWRGLTEPAK